jgi:signal transduction histidine kinase
MRRFAQLRDKGDDESFDRRPNFRKNRVSICLAPLATCGFLLLTVASAKAQVIAFISDLAQDFEAFGIAMSGGLALFSAVVAIEHIRQRNMWSRREAELSSELEHTRARLDRANVFLASEPQLLIAWDGVSEEPEIEAYQLFVTDTPVLRRALGFSTWLTPECARQLEANVDQLRRRGQAFRMALVGSSGRHFDADGRAIGGRAVLRIREVSGERLELISLREQHAANSSNLEGLRFMFEALPTPVWIRDAQGRISYVNSAYAQAVDAKDAAEVLARQSELLDQPARQRAETVRAKKLVWRERVGAVVAGSRRLLDVVEAPWSNSSAAIAFDRCEIEKMRADLEQQMQSHARTLEQLPIAVAIFDGAQRLVYHNPAYAELWRLDPEFLAQKPTDSEVLDRMRAQQRLPVEADYKLWKGKLLEAYRSPEQQEHIWHMPHGRTLRVVANPNPQGGVTYLYDDVSERYALESRFNALHRMQDQTLETLREGVAVFGADGRLKFSNPAFAAFWRLETSLLAEKPHFETISEHCRKLHSDGATWSALRSFVTGLSDMRSALTRRIERSDGLVLDVSAQPLPEGTALLTFVDVTAGVNVERVLTERNQALLAAEKLRNDFIHHVSYELRSPLNNINGFIHLLGEKSTGELNERQLEYLSYARKSTAALLAIINDILDLATIDENAMELELEDIDVESTMRAAAEGVQDRLAENSIELRIVTTGEVGSFRADSKRLRQILFNLLSNAIGFSSPGQAVILAALKRESEVVFKVSDHGRGIPPEVLEKVFDRFESHTAGSRHRGVGLGLSIVRAYTELHGGRVLIDSAPGEGTTVTCIFPARAEEAASPSVRSGARAS